MRIQFGASVLDNNERGTLQAIMQKDSIGTFYRDTKGEIFALTWVPYDVRRDERKTGCALLWFAEDMIEVVSDDFPQWPLTKLPSGFGVTLVQDAG